MKPETKLALRRRLLMILRAIMWHADEWLHRQELVLREELAAASPRRVAVREGTLVATPKCAHGPSQPETFLQWEARRSGVAPIAKKSRQRGLSAGECDLRFAR
jgi:hypothetical protein